MSKDLTVVILTKNEADNLRHLLPALSWVKKIMIVDSLSSDQTKQVAKQYEAEFISCSQDSFAQKRNAALSHLKTSPLLEEFTSFMPFSLILNTVSGCVPAGIL